MDNHIHWSQKQVDAHRAKMGGNKVCNEVPKPKRGQGRKLNKTETYALAYIKCLWNNCTHIGIQNTRLDFSDGTSYNPDFVLYFSNNRPTIIEVKGGHVGKVAWSRHGIERFRRARDVFEESFDFALLIRSKDGWVIE